MSEPLLFLDGKVTLYAGDCSDVVKTLADNSIDACVCDPPYALVSIVKRFGETSLRDQTDTSDRSRRGADGYARLARGFMGKEWDNGEVAFSGAFWREVLRVMKPGAHLVAFGGTRSYHELTCAIEGAGFEVRDQVKFDHDSSTEMTAFLDSLNDEQYAQFRKLSETDELGQLAWAYGTGFPKSHSVSKALDKAARGVPHGGSDPTSPNHGKYKTQATEGKRGDGDVGQGYGAGPGQFMAKGNPVRRIRPGASQNKDGSWEKLEDRTYQPHDYVPGSSESERWAGWGTALKPAWEPICLARKPLSEPTVAANVLRWGTGAINVDACRVEARDEIQPFGSPQKSSAGIMNGTGESRPQFLPSTIGRWPANIVNDGSEQVLAAFPNRDSSIRIDKPCEPNGSFKAFADGGLGGMRGARGFNDDGGSAARFFFSAKADADDRLGSKHPTVKPVDLMQWLCRLVTPPGGTILDPFSGTGTTGEAAWREGFNAVLIEREPEYQADIERRMKLCLAGPDERARESIKAKMKDKPVDHGPLFAEVCPHD